MDIESYKPKRMRYNVKKWTWPEEKAIVDFLWENRNFERPTGQIYYTNLSAKTNIIVEWKTIRAKVRNMRVNFKKAKAWKESTEALAMKAEKLKCALIEMCKHFYEFQEIFDGITVEPPVKVKEETLEHAESDLLNTTAARDSIEEYLMASDSTASVNSQQGTSSCPEISDTKRRCRYTRRKWYRTEEKAIVDFLMKNPQFEKPIAEIYYKRFASETNIVVEWKTIRAKVRNMRVKYQKAKAWMESTDAMAMEAQKLKNCVLRMCAFFYELEEIFNGSLVKEPTEIKLETPDFSEGSLLQVATDSPEELFLESASNDSTSPAISLTSQKSSSGPAVTDALGYQSELLILANDKQQRELSYKERQLRMNEMLLKLRQREVDVKLKEIESNERVKMRELEMKERVAMEEIRLKYK